MAIYGWLWRLSQQAVVLGRRGPDEYAGVLEPGEDPAPSVLGEGGTVTVSLVVAEGFEDEPLAGDPEWVAMIARHQYEMRFRFQERDGNVAVQLGDGERGGVPDPRAPDVRLDFVRVPLATMGLDLMLLVTSMTHWNHVRCQPEP